ncbi:unnamed protein product [Symbiodinium sp. CCMP2592]|nr:unnamed protein product [Symbiodinium sp. CCMP2592]
MSTGSAASPAAAAARAANAAAEAEVLDWAPPVSADVQSGDEEEEIITGFISPAPGVHSAVGGTHAATQTEAHVFISNFAAGASDGELAAAVGAFPRLGHRLRLFRRLRRHPRLPLTTPTPGPAPSASTAAPGGGIPAEAWLASPGTSSSVVPGPSVPEARQFWSDQEAAAHHVDPPPGIAPIDAVALPVPEDGDDDLEDGTGLDDYLASFPGALPKAPPDTTLPMPGGRHDSVAYRQGADAAAAPPSYFAAYHFGIFWGRAASGRQADEEAAASRAGRARGDHQGQALRQPRRLPLRLWLSLPRGWSTRRSPNASRPGCLDQLRLPRGARTATGGHTSRGGADALRAAASGNQSGERPSGVGRGPMGFDVSYDEMLQLRIQRELREMSMQPRPAKPAGQQPLEVVVPQRGADPERDHPPSASAGIPPPPRLPRPHRRRPLRPFRLRQRPRRGRLRPARTFRPVRVPGRGGYGTKNRALHPQDGTPLSAKERAEEPWPRRGGRQHLDRSVEELRDGYLGLEVPPVLRRLANRAVKSIIRGLGVLVSYRCDLAFDPTVVPHATDVLVLATWFMLREIEIAGAFGDVVLNKHLTAQAGERVLTRRSLRCACGVATHPLCPVHAMFRHFARLQEVGRLKSSAPLFPGSSGDTRSKAESLSFLALVLGVERPVFGGHACRVAGATFLAARGVPLAVIQLLGRWSSRAIERYTQALGQVVAAAQPGQQDPGPAGPPAIADAQEDPWEPAAREPAQQAALPAVQFVPALPPRAAVPEADHEDALGGRLDVRVRLKKEGGQGSEGASAAGLGPARPGARVLCGRHRLCGRRRHLQRRLGTWAVGVDLRARRITGVPELGFSAPTLGVWRHEFADPYLEGWRRPHSAELIRCTPADAAGDSQAMHLMFRLARRHADWLQEDTAVRPWTLAPRRPLVPSGRSAPGTWARQPWYLVHRLDTPGCRPRAVCGRTVEPERAALLIWAPPRAEPGGNRYLWCRLCWGDGVPLSRSDCEQHPDEESELE